MAADGALTYDAYLGHVERGIADIAALLGSDRAAADAPVPGCPDWTAADLRDHCAGVLAFWQRQVRIADPDADGPTFGADDRALASQPLDVLARELLHELRAAGEDRGCWNWSGEGLTMRWVARRMAQEFGVHRADAQATVGDEAAIDHELAADGIDELIDVFVAAPGPVGEHRVLTLASSHGWGWCLALDPEVGAARTDEPADLTVIGEPDQLLLNLWGRPALVTQDGDLDVMEIWRHLTDFG